MAIIETASDRITCRITLRRTSGSAILYGIISPKTGRKLEVMPALLAGCPRLAGRIVQGVSRGMKADFTLAELRAFADAAQRQAQPRPLRYWGKLPRRAKRPTMTPTPAMKAPAVAPAPAPVATPAPTLKPANTVAAVAARLAQVKAAADEAHAIAEEQRREAAMAKAEANAAACQKIIDEYVASVNARAEETRRREKESEAQRLADGRAVAFDLCRRMNFKTAALMQKLNGGGR